MAKKKANGENIKVYKGDTYYCALCRSALYRYRDANDVMYLLHMTNSCDLSGKKYEAPLEELVEIK